MKGGAVQERRDKKMNGEKATKEGWTDDNCLPCEFTPTDKRTRQKRKRAFKCIIRS